MKAHEKRTAVWLRPGRRAFPIESERRVVQRESVLRLHDLRAIGDEVRIRYVAIDAAWIAERISIVDLDEFLGSTDRIPRIAAQFGRIARAPRHAANVERIAETDGDKIAAEVVTRSDAQH